MTAQPLNAAAPRQRGIGLVEALLLTLLVGGALTTGLLWLQVNTATDQTREQVDVLAVADRAVEGFAATHFRLPCPDTDGDGHENCAGRADRGGLPWRDLAVEDPAMRERIRQLAYMVDRQGADLADDADRFEPGRLGTAEFRGVGTDGLLLDPSAGDDSYQFDRVTTADLCVGIGESAAVAGARAGGAAVSYGLAHPGARDMDGDGRLFDGANAAAATVMANPDRQRDDAYDDRVRVRTHLQLSDALDCASLGLSMESLSLATAAVNEVHSQQEWLIGIASLAAAVNAVKMAVAVSSIVTSAGDIGLAVGELSAAAAALSAAIASCVVIVGCAEIPHAAAWTAAAAASVVAGGVAIAANVTSVALNAAALGINLSVAIEMGVNLDNVETGLGDGPGIDVEGLVDTGDIEDDLIEARDEAEDEVEEREDEVAEAFDERQEFCNCGSNYNCRRYVDDYGYGLDAYLDDEMRGIMDDVADKTDQSRSDLIDYVNDVRGAANDNLAAQYALEEARDKLESADRDQDPDSADAIAGNEQLQGAKDDTLRELDDRIDALETELSSTSDPDERERLQAEIDAVEQAREEVESGFSGSSSDEQLAELNAGIEDINDNIAELDGDIASLEEQIDSSDGDQPQLEARLAELREQRAQLVASRDDLIDQRNQIDPDTDALEEAVDDAEQDVENTKDAFERTREDAIDAAQGTYEVEKQECTTDSDGNESCETVTETKEYDRGDDMADAIDTYFRPRTEPPDDDDVLPVASRYEACYLADIEWRESKAGLESAKDARDRAQQALDGFSAPDPDDPGGSGLNLWDESEATLEMADEKGGTR